MVITRYYVKEFSRVSPGEATDGRKEFKRSNEIPFTETRLLLSILGLVPCQLHRPYWPSLDLCKSTVLYCVVVYSLATFNMAWTMYIKVQQFAAEDSSNVVNKNLLFQQIVITLLPHLLGFTLFTDTNSISECIKSFTDIQDHFFSATGKEFINRRKTLERVYFGIVALFTAGFYICSQKYIPIMYVETTTAVALLYSNLILLLISIYWIGVSLSITDAFDEAKSSFESLVLNKAMNAQSMFKYRLLWLSLRTGMDSLGRLNVPAAVHSIILFLTAVILYGGAKCFQRGELLAGAILMVLAALYLVYFGLACIASDAAQLKMKALVGLILPNIPLSRYGSGAQREVMMLYLSENVRPAVLTMHGFTVINKTLILSFLINVATYVIVTVQFLDKS